MTDEIQSFTPNTTVLPSDLAELEDLFPINSPELGIGADASDFGDAEELEEGKKEDIFGEVSKGKTVGEAEMIGSLVEHRKC